MCSDGRSGDSLAYTCVGDPGNALTCNDGYHVRSMAHKRLPNQVNLCRLCQAWVSTACTGAFVAVLDARMRPHLH